MNLTFEHLPCLLLSMKTLTQNFLASARILFPSATRFLALASLFSLSRVGDAAETGKTFATPEAAVSALVSATTTKDNQALHALFGPAGADLENPDRVQSTNELSAFTTAFNETNRLARLSDSQYVLEVGSDLWPFP